MFWKTEIRSLEFMGSGMIPELKSSSKRVGQLYPVLLDYHGNIIDGEHRYGVDEGWKTMRLKHIRTEKDRLIARIISNTVRRTVPSREKTELLAKLGEIYLNEGVEPGSIAYKIAEETGMSYTWVAKYLPEKFKESLQSERRSGSVTRCVTGKDPKRRVISFELEEPPKGAVAIKAYGNTNFVNIMLEKQFYKQLEEKAKRLETTPDKLIYNAILLILKNLSRCV
jgi:hypothetical protein